MGMKFSWKEASRISHSDATVVATELEKLQEEKGSITPEDMLEKARPEDSVLHELFEWDDGIAAEKYRLSQARYYIRMVLVEIKDNGREPIVTRAFVDVGEQNFQPISVAVQDKTMREYLIEQARKDIDAFEKKYAVLVEVIKLLEPIKKKLKKLK